MFSGSFRSNLDPFSQAESDATIWGALRQAGLDGMVRSMGVSAAAAPAGAAPFGMHCLPLQREADVCRYRIALLCLHA